MLMTTTINDHRSIVVLKLPTPVQALVTYAIGIVKAMTGDAITPRPHP
jgi:hypothetical protein